LSMCIFASRTQLIILPFCCSSVVFYSFLCSYLIAILLLLRWNSINEILVIWLLNKSIISIYIICSICMSILRPKVKDCKAIRW
jgi:hypothetical protein